LKLFQSKGVRSPRFTPEAEGRLKVSAAFDTEIEKSEPLVEEANVIAVALVVAVPLPSVTSDPAAEVTHTPLIAKQPPARLMPPLP